MSHIRPSICVVLGFVASGLTALYAGATSPAYWIVTALMVLWLSVLVRQMEEPSIGAAEMKDKTLGTIIAALLQYVRQRNPEADPDELARIAELYVYRLPVYVAGMGYGVNPVNDWFTAQVDGREVLVLEHVKESDASQQ